MNRSFPGLAAAVALAASSLASATGPASTNYALPVTTLNAGVGNMASASYKLSSSLGDPFSTVSLSSNGYRLRPGPWGVLPVCLVDIDGNGAVEPLADGLMLLRAMFGLTGTAVTNGAVGSGATRTTWAEIQPVIQLGKLDLDGNGKTEPLTDGLMLLRAMSGLTGLAVTRDAVANGAPRATWTDVRAFINASCGTNFAP